MRTRTFAFIHGGFWRLLCLLGLSAPFLAGTQASPENYTIIEKLPDRLRTAIQEHDQIIDSDEPVDILRAATKYRDVLLGMARDLATTYPAKAGITPAQLDDFVKNFAAVERFKIKLGGKTNNENKTQSYIANRLAGELENITEEMVASITRGDPRFDYQDWKKRWEAAKDSGE